MHSHPYRSEDGKRRGATVGLAASVTATDERPARRALPAEHRGRPARRRARQQILGRPTEMEYPTCL